MKRLLYVFLAAIFVTVGALCEVQAAVDLRSNPNANTVSYRGAAFTPKVNIPAERTMRIGNGHDGHIVLRGVGARPLSWVAGAGYDIADVLQMYITPMDDAKLLNGAGWVMVGGPWTQAIGTYASRWTVVVGAGTHVRVRPRHMYTRNGGDYTVPVGISSKLATGGNLLVYADTNADNLDVTNVTGVKTYNMLGRAVRGGIPIDLPSPVGTVNQILQTITQYSYTGVGARAAVVISTIDAINHQAHLFSGSRLVSGVGQFSILSAAFAGTVSYAPTFIATDSLIVTLTGNHAFQGVSNVVFGGAATFTRGVGAATNAASFTLSNANLLAQNAGAGQSGVPLALDIFFAVNGVDELLNRTVAVDATLRLNGTGNGAIPLGTWGSLLSFRQNGTLFRLGRIRTATDQETYVRFSSTAATDTAFDVRYYREDGTSTAWTRYGATLPANGSLSISKADLMALLAIPASENGFVEFRLHTALVNVVAVAQAKMGTTGWANIPMYYLDVANNFWR